MKCFHCQAELQRGTATFTDSRKSYVIVLQDLPAWVCPQCGEPLFEEAAVEGIQTVLRTLDEQVGKLHQAA
jgi:YgiT-type zinc finger domain-containing protein